MSAPERIQLSRKKGFRLPPNTLVVSRPSKWGNPFIVGEDGNREHCVYLFRQLLTGHLCISKSAECIERQRMFVKANKSLSELRGKNLACWCRGNPCHASVLLEAANI